MSYMTIHFSMLANHQSRHQATSKTGCQPSDCRWRLLIFLMGYCGYVWHFITPECRECLLLRNTVSIMATSFLCMLQLTDNSPSVRFNYMLMQPFEISFKPHIKATAHPLEYRNSHYNMSVTRLDLPYRSHKLYYEH